MSRLIISFNFTTHPRSRVFLIGLWRTTFAFCRLCGQSSHAKNRKLVISLFRQTINIINAFDDIDGDGEKRSMAHAI